MSSLSTRAADTRCCVRNTVVARSGRRRRRTSCCLMIQLLVLRAQASLLLLLLLVSISSVQSFPVPSRGGRGGNNNHRHHHRKNCPSTTSTSLAASTPPLSSQEVQARLRDRLRQLREQDRHGRTIAVDDLQIVFEDDHLIVVDKPVGVLCLPSTNTIVAVQAEDADGDDGVDASVPPPSLAQTVFDYCQQKWQRQQQPRETEPSGEANEWSSTDRNADDDRVQTMQQMVVHRLGFDTSGLLVLGKTLTAVRGLHALFRTRNITRQYEVLVAGHMVSSGSSAATEPEKAAAKDEKQPLPQDSGGGENDDTMSTKHGNAAGSTTATTGLINLPLMRCYEHPPYIRVSTDEHQRNLMHLDAAIVGKKLLEAPKASLTHYQVIDSSEHWRSDPELPVTRLTLTSLTGRTHQLNVHCAAIGRPIVGDAVYGYGGRAAPRGGLARVADECGNGGGGAPEALQQRLAAAADRMCVHAKLVRFRHPVTGEDVEFTSPPPF